MVELSVLLCFESSLTDGTEPNDKITVSVDLTQQLCSQA